MCINYNQAVFKTSISFSHDFTIGRKKLCISLGWRTLIIIILTLLCSFLSNINTTYYYLILWVVLTFPYCSHNPLIKFFALIHAICPLGLGISALFWRLNPKMVHTEPYKCGPFLYRPQGYFLMPKLIKAHLCLYFPLTIPK